MSDLHLHPEKASSAITATATIAHPRAQQRRKRLEKWSIYLIWCGGFLAALAVGKNLCESYQQSESAHAIRCDQPVQDVGNVYGGDDVEVVFQVQNAGKRPIIIEKVMFDCGCTTLKESVEGTVIAPNAFAAIPINVAIGNIDREKVQKKIVVRFDSKGKPELTLKVQANVRAFWTVAPPVIVFDRVSATQTSSQSLEISCPISTEKSVIPLVQATSHLQAQIEPIERGSANRAWRVTVSTNIPLPPGRLSDTVIIKLPDESSRRQLDIPVKIFVADGKVNQQASPSIPASVRSQPDNE